MITSISLWCRWKLNLKSFIQLLEILRTKNFEKENGKENFGKKIGMKTFLVGVWLREGREKNW